MMQTAIVYTWHPRRFPHRRRRSVPYPHPMALRDLALISYHEENPRATLKEMGQEFAITRERVRQILSRVGLRTRRTRKYICQDCGKALAGATKSGRCRECQKVFNRITLTCAICGLVFQRRRRLHFPTKHPRILAEAFCSKKCYGRFIGLHHGFVAHPENIARNKCFASAGTN